MNNEEKTKRKPMSSGESVKAVQWAGWGLRRGGKSHIVAWRKILRKLREVIMLPLSGKNRNGHLYPSQSLMSISWPANYHHSTSYAAGFKIITKCLAPGDALPTKVSHNYCSLHDDLLTGPQIALHCYTLCRPSRPPSTSFFRFPSHLQQTRSCVWKCSAYIYW